MTSPDISAAIDRTGRWCFCGHRFTTADGTEHTKADHSRRLAQAWERFVASSAETMHEAMVREGTWCG